MTKTALVTGAAAGIGRSCALRLDREGINIGVLDLNIEGCQQVVAEIEAEGSRAVALQASIADRPQVTAAVDKYLQFYPLRGAHRRRLGQDVRGQHQGHFHHNPVGENAPRGENRGTGGYRQCLRLTGVRG